MKGAFKILLIIIDVVCIWFIFWLGYQLNPFNSENWWGIPFVLTAIFIYFILGIITVLYISD